MGTTSIFEPLEARALFSVVWINRGHDNFAKYYGHNANLARQLVDQAIAEWNALLPGVNENVTISAGKLDKKVGKYTLGWTSGTNVTLDNNGGSHGWYFDKNVADNSDFYQKIDSTAAVGAIHNHEDFFTTIEHELGHAAGFHDKDDPSGGGNASNAFSTLLVSDDNHTSIPNDLMNAIQPINTRRYITAHDLYELGVTNANPQSAEPLF